ncbi:NAD(P)-dependent oxidoreductase [Rhizobium sp. 0TCS1.26]|uniref:NAD(P)-dependent oxidoreductase n=1 Tax=Rhizobium sp. 0TCS1.26 TaxID=3142623 RepID=UPI003D2991BD
MHRERIGVVGLGRMGSAIAERLASQGYQVTGWSRRGLTMAEGTALGIAVAADLGYLAAEADILILSLMDEEAVAAVLTALAGHDLANRLIVETSTVGPDIIRHHAPGLAAAGGSAIDAPISGGPDLLRLGRAGFYIGGSETDVARFRPVAEALSDRIHHVGPLGDGATAKLVNNMMLLGIWQTLKEALQLGQAAGLTRETMLAFLEGSPAASPAMRSRLPVILGQSDTVGFSLSGVVKDARVVEALAEALQLDLPATQAARQSFEAVEAKGYGEADLAMMVRIATQGKDNA